MFLCQSCLEKKFKNFAISFSRGKCEHCEKIERCVDIPSKYLIRKEKVD